MKKQDNNNTDSFNIQGFSQETSAENKIISTAKSSCRHQYNYKVVLPKLLVYEDSKDAVNLRLGSRGVTILESLEGEKSKVEFENYRSDNGSMMMRRGC